MPANTGLPVFPTPAQIGAIASAEKGVADGVATLDENAKIPLAQLPDIDINVENFSYDSTNKAITLTETDGTKHTISISDLVDTETVTTLVDNGDGSFTYTNESGTTTTFTVPKEVDDAVTGLLTTWSSQKISDEFDAKTGVKPVGVNQFGERVEAQSVSDGSGVSGGKNTNIAGLVGMSQPNGAACQSALTYAQALAFATAQGGRLPTLEEVQSGAMAGTGCGFDTTAIWTQTKGNTDGERMVEDGEGFNPGYDGSVLSSLPETSTANVRIVYDTVALGTENVLNYEEEQEVLDAMEAELRAEIEELQNNTEGLEPVAVNQVAHGFAVGTALTKNATGYQKMGVNDMLSAIVAEVTDADNFIIQNPYSVFDVSFYAITEPALGYVNEGADGVISTTKSAVSKPVFAFFGNGKGAGMVRDAQVVENEFLTAEGHRAVNLWCDNAKYQIFSEVDNNVIYKNGVEIAQLNAGESYANTDLNIGDEISAKGRFSDVLGGSPSGGDVNDDETYFLTRKEHAGTEFAFAFTRNSPHTVRFKDFEGGTVQIFLDGVLDETITTSKNQVIERVYTANTGVKVVSTGIIGLVFTSTPYDHAIATPTAKDMIGFSAGSAWITPTGTGTIQVKGSASNNALSATNGVRLNTTFGGGSLYRGQALRFTAPFNFSGHSTADSDGGQIAMFQDVNQATDLPFTLPFDGAFLTLASLETGTVTLTPPAGEAIQGFAVDEVVTLTLEKTNTDPDAPFVARIGITSGTDSSVWIPDGTLITPSVPVLKWGQCIGTGAYPYGYDDENALHFGLSDEFYTDFTGGNPNIRQSPDGNFWDIANITVDNAGVLSATAL